MSFRDSMTLGEARDELRELVDEGAQCPCCTQRAKVYPRKIHATMAMSLVVLVRDSQPGEWVHLPTKFHRRAAADVPKLAYWGLLEEEKVRRPDGGRAGYWRVTELGRAFATRQTNLPRIARVYDGRCLGLVDDEMVSIVDCLSDRFDYDELMRGFERGGESAGATPGAVGALSLGAAPSGVSSHSAPAGTGSGDHTRLGIPGEPVPQLHPEDAHSGIHPASSVRRAA